jgi:ectoine hydroxylase-related dioxygenase (phytanoyl-CoA dioxygenase family)
MPYKDIFVDTAHNIALAQHGYAIVPFLTNTETQQLTSFFYENHQELPDGMYASSHARDFSFRKKMNEEIKSVCARAMENTFLNATPLGSTFMVKSKGENGSLHPHQDWSIVDEKKFNSYNIWLPLVDVNEQNGTLLILPNSHELFDNIRGLNIPSSFAQVEKEVWQYLIPINMKAGEALVYDHRLLHASGINKTTQPRLVVVYGVIPTEATMRYYYGKENTIEEYECTADFYFNETITQGPTGLKMLQSIANNNPVATQTLLNSKYATSKTLLQTLLSFFK